MKTRDLYQKIRAPFVSVVVLLAILSCVLEYSYGFEMEYNGPGSEMDRSMSDYRDNENREASERCGRDKEEGRESSDRDREKADNYNEQHGA